MGDTILLPSQNSRPWARTVATVVKEIESKGVTVVLLYVFDEREIASIRANSGSDAPMETDVLATRKSGIETAIEELENSEVNVEVRGTVHEGEPADSILSIMDEEDVDRIYAYGRKRSSAGKAVFGSTLQRVLFNSPVPVVVVPSNVDR